MSRTREPRWTRSSPRIDADLQVGHEDPGGRSDRINGAMKQVWEEFQRIARDLYVDPTLDGNGAARLSGPLQPWVQYDGLRRQGGTLTNHGGVRYGGAYVSDGTYIYSIGGREDGSTLTDAVDRYDPLNDVWVEDHTTLPGGSRELHGAAYYAGKIYVWGGLDSGGSIDAGTDVYTIATDTWSTLGNSISRYGFGYTFLTNSSGTPFLYMIGGADSGATPTDDVARMDLSQIVPSWSQLGDALSQMPNARVHCTAVWDPASTRVYVLGGDDSGGTAQTSNYALDYNLTVPEWETKAVLPAARRNVGGALVRGYPIAAGGSTGTTVQSTCYVYSPKADSWSASAWSIDALPTAVDRPMLASAEGSLFLLGGRTNVSTGAGSSQHVVCAIGPKLFDAPRNGVYTTIEQRNLTDANVDGRSRGLVNLTRGFRSGSVGAFAGDEIGVGVEPDYEWSSGANGYFKVVG